MPGVVLVGMDLTLRRQQVERGKLEIGYSMHGPAILSIGINILCDQFLLVTIGYKKRLNILALLCCLFQTSYCLICCSTRGRAYCGVLLKEQCLSFDRPWHQFTIQAGPPCRILLPEVHSI